MAWFIACKFLAILGAGSCLKLLLTVSARNSRGRSYFRRKNEDNEASMDGEDNNELDTHVRRSEFQPRRLFTAGKEAQSGDDEEALTDIEDATTAQSELQPGTPKASETKQASTPDAPRHAPMSPPETRSTTRFTNKLGAGASKSQQPDQRRVVDYFSSRGSRSREAGSPTKRVGESLTPDRPKRARNC